MEPARRLDHVKRIGRGHQDVAKQLIRIKRDWREHLIEALGSEAARSAVAKPLAPAAPRGAPGRRPPSPPPLRQERRRRPHGSNYSSSPAPLLACRAMLKGRRENTTHASLIQIGRGLQESLTRVLSPRDERQEPANWRSTRRASSRSRAAPNCASPPPPPAPPECSGRSMKP